MRIESINTNFNLYDLQYRDRRFYRNPIEINPSKDTIDYIMDVLETARKLASGKPKISEAIQFSAVVYNMMPVVNKDNSIRYEYSPMLSNNNGKEDVNEYINRFKDFNVDNLPLIEVAKYLKVKVEKSKVLKHCWGRYNSGERKITLGTDYEPVFIHELAHAIDSTLSNLITESSFSELVAESSTVILCREYSIKNDFSASFSYLDHYTDTEIEVQRLIERVATIYEFVKIAKQDIRNGIYDLWKRI